MFAYLVLGPAATALFFSLAMCPLGFFLRTCVDCCCLPCDNYCQQYYMLDEEGNFCSSAPLDSITIASSSGSGAIEGVEIPWTNPQGVTPPPGSFPVTAITIAGPYTFSSELQSGHSAVVYVTLKGVTLEPEPAECGCGKCRYVFSVLVYSLDSLIYTDSAPYESLQGASIVFDRCGESTKSLVITLPGALIGQALAPYTQLISEDPYTEERVCPSGFTDDGSGGCYRDDTYTSDLICEGDPGYDDAVSDGCQAMIGQQVEIVPGNPGTVTDGTPITMFPDCIACEYTVRTTTSKDQCPAGYISDGDGSCIEAGVIYDHTFPGTFDDVALTITIDHDEPCDCGACCTGETCTSNVPEMFCERDSGAGGLNNGLNGTWQGAGTDCDPNPCENPFP